jgi:hypothetical protein
MPHTGQRSCGPISSRPSASGAVTAACGAPLPASSAKDALPADKQPMKIPKNKSVNEILDLIDFLPINGFTTNAFLQHTVQ